MKIVFFVGSVDISGGTYVIYQHARYASEQGHDVTIAARLPYESHQLAWHPATRALRIVPIDQLGEEQFDLAIATWWKTAAELHRLHARQYAYFVQSIESRFYAETEIPLRHLVDSTYALPLPGITEAVWIQEYIERNFGHCYRLAQNGISKDLYEEQGEAEASRLPKGCLRVLVEGPFGVHFKNVGRTLKLAWKAKPDEIWLLTPSDVPWYPGVQRVFSRVPISRLAAIYRSCDVILKLSYVEGMFGPPLEMFHCGGTAIVYDVTGHDEYMVHGRNGLVVRQDDEAGVLEALRCLRRDPALLARLKDGARETARHWPDWSAASSVFLRAIEEIVHEPHVSREAIEVHNRAAWSQYNERERQRLTANPSIKIRYMLNALLNRMPRGAARSVRLGRYVFEGWR